ncbi:BamA/TamA family outer membrane protein [bacterium]|nr:BamA/TamA family outer membrane protein [bacterium]
MKLSRLFYLLALCLAAGGGFAQNSETSIVDDDVIDQIRKKYFSNSKNFMIVQGDYEMKSGRVIDKDILVVNGNLRIAGTLNGSVVVTNGNIVLEGEGEIIKNAVVIHGKIIVEDAKQVEGSQEEIDWKDLNDDGDARVIAPLAVKPELPELPVIDENQMESIHDNMQSLSEEMRQLAEEMKARQDQFTAGFNNRYKREMQKNRKKDRDENWDENQNWNRDWENENSNDPDEESSGGEDWGDEGDRWNDFSDVDFADEIQTFQRKYKTNYFTFDYNRVDGAYLGLKIEKNHKIYRNKPFNLYGELGYAFSRGKFNYQLGLDKFWGRAFRFEAGGEFHDLTGTQDSWLVGHYENAMNALLFKNDYRDYYRLRGYGFHASQNLNPYLKLTAGYNSDEYFSLPNEVRWGLFLPKKDFRVNPAVDEGTMVTVSGAAEFNNLSEYHWKRKITKRRGWKIEARGEKGLDKLNSDFQFARYTVQAARYQPLSRWENLDVRLMIGAATGDVPVQKLFYLGGISTLRGHNFKEFSGNQMALANVEYRVSSGRFSDDRIFLLDPFSLILFMDAGYTWNNKIYSYRDAAKGVNLNDMETDLGVGFGDESDFFRIDVAKNISVKNSSYKVNFRINYAF